MIASLRMRLTEQRPEIAPVTLLFALSVFLHVAQDFAYSPLLAIGLLAGSTAVILFPTHLFLLALLSAIVSVDFFSVTDGNSNSTFLQWMVASTFLAGYIARPKPEDYAATTYPALRQLLLVMYFFGIFHKLNDGWVHPVESCAVQLWQRITLPGLPGWTVYPWFKQLLIWGTLVGEAIFIAGLVAKGRWKIACMLGGIAFHAFIAFSNFRHYYAFSIQAFMLYACFLPIDPKSARRIMPLAQRAGFLIISILLAALVYQPPSPHYGWQIALDLLWAGVSIGFLYWCFRLLRRISPQRSALCSPVAAVNCVALFYFLHSTGPYLGMQTGASLTMFSNLYTERPEGVTNHWLISNRIDLFPWQRQTVHLLHSNDSVIIKKARKSGYILSLHDLLKLLRNRPEHHASFQYNGNYYHQKRYRDVAHLGRLWPSLLDHTFSFKERDVEARKRCTG